jgi:polysaccharide pyruvyl transferase WcaK-like protein
MYVVIEPGQFAFTNIGDVAMLQVTVARLKQLAPLAELLVFTRDPENIRLMCPGAQPLDATIRHAWVKERLFPYRIRRTLKSTYKNILEPMELHLRARWPRLWITADRIKSQFTASSGHATALSLLRLMKSASAFVLAGMGGMNDEFKSRALEMLDLLQLAQSLGRKTVMLSQGIGPISDPVLWARARQVLPRVDIIALREQALGPKILAQLGVNKDRVLVTGDDAIELALPGQPNCPGNALGINIRVARYSYVTIEDAKEVLGRLRVVAAKRSIDILPVPITGGEVNSDVRVLSHLMDIPVPFDDSKAPDLPRLLDLIRRCRVVVCGSYHAALFALANGIPCVCVARSPYYLAKFQGLASMFGNQCVVLSMEDPQFESMLEASIDRAWATGDEDRKHLQKLAREQARRGLDAYAAVVKLILSEDKRPRAEGSSWT